MSQDFPFTGAPERLQGEPSSATPKVPPHVAVLRDSVQHIGGSLISRGGISSYIPTAFNMFAMLDAMCYSLVDNSHLHEICPEFFTPALYLYYSHVIYFHILRARVYAGTTSSTLLEKRLLSQYERIAPIESWPIAAPLIGFIQAMGAHKPDSYYSWVIPSLPDFSRLKTKKGLAGLEHVPGMLRLPIVPVFQKFLHNFACPAGHAGRADYENGVLHPGGLPLGEKGQFIGISSSAADSPSFLAITHNLCWKLPAETGYGHAFDKITAKRAQLRAWGIPDIPDNATLNTAESFLGFGPKQRQDWMKKLLMMASSVNRFFPNSTTLSKIPPFTTLGSLTHVEYARDSPDTVKDTWYYDRGDVHLGFRGFTNTEDGWLDTQLGIATSPNAEFLHWFPADVLDADPTRKGPFFVDDDEAKDNRRRNAIFRCEGFQVRDPASAYSQLVARGFDATGGKEV